MERRYDFKKALLELHKPNIRNNGIKSRSGEFEIRDGFKIIIPEECDKVVFTAVKDFSDYLFVSMNVENTITRKSETADNSLIISLNQSIGSASGYMGYRVTANENFITLEGYDSRGVAQGLYALEDMMNIKKAPIIKHGVTERKALFSPRITQSPFGMFEYTDAALSLLAHYGYDAIDVWIQELNKTLRGDYIDLPMLCERAEKYGIDVYIELYAKHSVHPSDEGAEEFYESMYAPIFKACPKIRGFTFVGEATEFNSRDPKAGKAPRLKNFIDNIPTGKCTPGWWPCSDYPDIISLLQKIAKKHIPDIDIIFCSYNWGYAPLAERDALINNLPDGISVMATWDMFEQIKTGDSVQTISDYSLRFEGPGKYFISEAECVKKRGLKMYTISNTSGRTWDFGTVPYEPFPFQWIKKFENIVKAHDELNLRGLVENIHYAFQPSFISDIQKEAFFTNGRPLCELLRELIARYYGEDNCEAVEKALRLWSEGITHYPPTNEDQYGAFRIGPAYPFWLSHPDVALTPILGSGKKPDEFNAMFGNRIYFPFYTPDVAALNSLPGVRIYDEINELRELNSLLLAGIEVLDEIKEAENELFKLKNLGSFIQKHCVTALNYKNLYILLQKLNIAESKENAEMLLDGIEKLLLSEKENVISTVPIVQADSRLGYEPSMEYVCDEKALMWKLRQLEHELTITLPKLRKANSL